MSWLLSNLLKWLEEGGIWIINKFIASIASAISVVVGLLPSMPSAPTLSGDFLSWVSYGEYWFPVTYMLTLGATMLTLWMVIFVIRIPLRWFKVDLGDGD